MWYEILPPLMIIGGVIGAAGTLMYNIDKYLVYGGKPRRTRVDTFNRRMMERDESITGNSNIQQLQVYGPRDLSPSGGHGGSKSCNGVSLEKPYHQDNHRCRGWQFLPEKQE